MNSVWSSTTLRYRSSLSRRSTSAHLREMADRAEHGEYHWLYIAAQPMDGSQLDDDLYVCSAAVPEFNACLLAAIEGVDEALADAAGGG